MELDYFELLRKGHAISPTKRAALDRKYAASSLPACGSSPPIVQGASIAGNQVLEVDLERTMVHDITG